MNYRSGGDHRVTRIEGHHFLGWGPDATGPGSGWTMRSDLFARCIRCGDLLSLDPVTDDTCRCGRLMKDAIGRFGSADGDDSTAIYKTS